MSLDAVFESNNLIAAFCKTSEETHWKESIQRYEMNLLKNIEDAQEQYRTGTYKVGETHDFTIHERGHVRRIKSQYIFDRVVLVSFVDNVLLPKLRPKLIYDNGASLKGKGIDFSRRRFCVHLNRFYQRNGNKGYIRFFDFSKYFDNIRHDIVAELFNDILEPDELEFLKMILRNFEMDLSALSDEEFEAVDNGIYNSIDYAFTPKGDGSKMLRKGVGIGSPVSQAIGIYFPYKIDNYIKSVLGVKEYGRYMDDFYVMAESIEKLDEWTEKIKAKCEKYALFISQNKVRTCRMDKEFIYLKTIYRVKPDGTIVKRIHHSAIERERHRLKKHKGLIANGRMTLDEVKACYRGWRGCYAKTDSKRALQKMDEYFMGIFDTNLDFLNKGGSASVQDRTGRRNNTRQPKNERKYVYKRWRSDLRHAERRCFGRSHDHGDTGTGRTDCDSSEPRQV